MPQPQTLLIVGAGLAGAKAAEGARAHGFDGRIIVVGEEAHPPYERPPLSKAVLRGEEEASTTHVHDTAFYSTHLVDLLPDRRVIGLDVQAREARLDNGDMVAFDSAVLATGATPRALSIPGAELSGVHYLRTVDDAVALGAAIRAAHRVAVIGAGWIGTEAAASARQMGAEVVLIDPLDVPLQRVLGSRIGDVFGRLHTDHGVQLRMTAKVSELSGPGRVAKVVLDDGRVEAADVVIVGIGVQPRVELASAAGLAVEDGVLVDEYLQTSAAGIYAAGDIANALHPHLGQRLRVEHWANALNQGMTAGANATGAHQPYTRLPYFFSDQFDLGMEYHGHADPHDELVLRGDLEARKFIAFWLRDGQVRAAMNVNIWDVGDDLKALITASNQIDRRRLADPDVPLADVSTPAVSTGSS
jgi:3-phenylpropionate/trans-cinnamate dioxygenase ferredoxin reductase subunit